MSLRFKKYPIYGGKIGLVGILVGLVPVISDRLAAAQQHKSRQGTSTIEDNTNILCPILPKKMSR